MTTTEATVEPLLENMYGVTVPVDEETAVRAVLICGTRYSLLLDTLLSPHDLDPIRGIVEATGLPLMIVNSHADWDHWWGNAAFPDAPVLALDMTATRQRREGARSLARHRRQDQHRFVDVSLRPATITFSESLTVDLGGMTVELHRLPGHTADCIVAHVPERRLLFAGDTAEDPIPLVGDGATEGWTSGLLNWADRVRIVIPSHGPVSGPELLRRNAAYLRGLRQSPERPVAELEGASPFYRRAHRRNRRLVAG